MLHLAVAMAPSFLLGALAAPHCESFAASPLVGLLGVVLGAILIARWVGGRWRTATVAVAGLAAALGFVHTLPSPEPAAPVVDGVRVTVRGTVERVRSLPGASGAPPRRAVRLDATRLLAPVSAPLRGVTLLIADREALADGVEVEATGWMRAAGRDLEIRVRDASGLRIIASPLTSVRCAVHAARRDLSSRLGATCSPRAAALARALVLGERDDDDRRRELQRSAGAAHLFAVSGLHLGLATWLVVRLLASVRMPARVAMPLVLTTLLGYALLSGGRPPVWRAFGAVVLIGVGRASGRSVDVRWVLIVVGAGSLAVRPGLATDPGFVLSMLAMAGLLFASHPVDRDLDDPLGAFVSRTRSRWWSDLLTRSARASWAALLATSPASLGWFGSLAPVALVANLVLLPLVSATLVAGAVVLVFPPLAPLLEAAAIGLDGCLAALARLPGGFIERPPPTPWALGIHVLVLLGSGLGLALGHDLSRRRRGLLRLLPVVTLVALLVLPAVDPPPPWTLIDDVVLMQLDGETWVVDRGSQRMTSDEADRVRRRLRKIGISRVETVVSLGTPRPGLMRALEGVRVARVLGPEGTIAPVTSQLIELRGGGAIIRSRRGHARLEVLSPTHPGAAAPGAVVRSDRRWLVVGPDVEALARHLANRGRRVEALILPRSISPARAVRLVERTCASSVVLAPAQRTRQEELRRALLATGAAVLDDGRGRPTNENGDGATVPE